MYDRTSDLPAKIRQEYYCCPKKAVFSENTLLIPPPHQPNSVTSPLSLFTITVISTTSGLYYKPMTIVNEDSRVVNELKTSLTDDARVIIYDRHMFIVQATGDLPLSIIFNWV
jgi:hypothetical protein